MYAISRTLRAVLAVLAAVPALVASMPAAVAAQQSSTSAPDMAPAAREYLSAALDTLQSASMHAATTDWAAVRDSAFLLAAGAVHPRDTWGAINWALRRVDRHSFLQAGVRGVAPELVAGRYGYLRVPFYAGPMNAPLTDSLQSALRTLEQAGACGWILDLRMNGGGNIWPMQTGIAPLVGDTVLSLQRSGGRVIGSTVYSGGATFMVDSAGTREEATRAAHPYVMQRPDAPVAVLLDGATASSAEGIAIIFRTRPKTRFFGAPTAGYSSINEGYALPDGANMVITVGVMQDRAGRPYGGPIEPDELIAMPDGHAPTAGDRVARRAAEWLAAQPECGVARGTRQPPATR